MAHQPAYISLPWQKRALDIAASLFLLALSVPFVVCLLIWIFLEQVFYPVSRGPLFYREARVSGGRVIRFVKFRIFKVSALEKAAQDNGVIHTKDLEHRKKNMTHYGRFLKKIYMDELPQLWLVLNGDMSLVGPRPTNVENTAAARAAGDRTKDRIRCGITGPFQSEKATARDQRMVDEKYIAFVRAHTGW